MIAVLKQGTTQAQRENLCTWFRDMGLKPHIFEGEFHCIIGLIGDTSKVDMGLLSSLSIIESVKRISEPFKEANRQFHPEPTVVDVHGVKIGGRMRKHPLFIAGMIVRLWAMQPPESALSGVCKLWTPGAGGNGVMPELPVATDEVLGGIKASATIVVEADGRASAVVSRLTEDSYATDEEVEAVLNDIFGAEASAANE